MERLTLANLRSALQEKKLLTQIPEQKVNNQVNGNATHL
jgi:hypothetical protein